MCFCALLLAAGEHLLWWQALRHACEGNCKHAMHVSHVMGACSSAELCIGFSLVRPNVACMLYLTAGRGGAACDYHIYMEVRGQHIREHGERGCAWCIHHRKHLLKGWRPVQVGIPC